MNINVSPVMGPTLECKIRARTRKYKRKATSPKGELSDVKKDLVSYICATTTEGAGGAMPRLSVILDKLYNYSLKFYKQ